MKDSTLRLQDKTVFLTGPFVGITQAILRTMTEFGADVAYVNEQNSHASKFVDSVNEIREARPDYGRAVNFQMPLNTDAQMQEVLGQIVGSLGRMDVLIDARPLAWDEKTNVEESLAQSRLLADKVMPFLLAKNRGRILYVADDPCLQNLSVSNVCKTEHALLQKMVLELVAVGSPKNVTANAVTIGVNEDFLLKHFPRSPSLKKSLEALQKDYPGLKLVESSDVGLTVAALTSALTTCLTGQVIRLNHGFTPAQNSAAKVLPAAEVS